MIALWMLYAAVIGCLMAAAAHALEHLVAQYGWSRRWVWLIAMAALPIVPLLTRSASMAPTSTPAVHDVSARIATVRPSVAYTVTPHVAQAAQSSSSPIALGTRALVTGAQRGVKSVIAVAAMPAVMIRQAQAHQERLARFDRPLAWVWAALSALLVGLYAAAAVRLCRQRRRWPAAQVDGESVLIAPNAGPAVVGLFQPAIVLPAWTLGIDARHRALILQHEREHMQARDPLVLHFVTVTTYLVPWNLAMWWMLRRLRIAVELDCDRRVLLAGHDAHRYADLLLVVGRRRAQASRLLVPALVERQSLLARRILAMCPQRAKFQRLRSTCAAGAAYLMFAAAFAIPMPALKTLARPAKAPTIEARSVTRGTELTFLADSVIGTLVGDIHPAAPADAPSPKIAGRRARAVRAGSRDVQSATPTPALPALLLQDDEPSAASSTLTFRIAADSSRGQMTLRAKSRAAAHDTSGMRVEMRGVRIQQRFHLQDTSSLQLVPMALLGNGALEVRGVGTDSADVSDVVADSLGSLVPSIRSSMVRALTSFAAGPLQRVAVLTTDSASAGTSHDGRTTIASMVAVNFGTSTTHTIVIDANSVSLSPAGGVKSAPLAVHP